MEKRLVWIFSKVGLPGHLLLSREHLVVPARVPGHKTDKIQATFPTIPMWKSVCVLELLCHLPNIVQSPIFGLGTGSTCLGTLLIVLLKISLGD